MATLTKGELIEQITNLEQQLKANEQQLKTSEQQLQECKATNQTQQQQLQQYEDMNTHLVQTLLRDEKTRTLIVDALREEINQVIDARIREKLTMHTTIDYSRSTTEVYYDGCALEESYDNVSGY
jgi:hypothetical protein|uniref:Uncharacterized protein n=1 Tax=Myoviridae sp. ct0f722 TaxID=2827599 RepID=A0A8S5LPW1_9CAUD|nr:MAG TPA: hypothetical protein [Myoviridae sp. ct0f722]